MRNKILMITAMLAVMVAMTGIASAAETVITFDDRTTGEILTNQYASSGVSFSGATATIIDISLGNKGFTANSDYSEVIINFVPNDIKKVSLDVSGSMANILQGFQFLDASGNPIDVDAVVGNPGAITTLTVTNQTTPIKSVRITSALSIAGLKMDNLSFSSSIPEFPAVALPVAAVIGLVFLFQQKKRKEE